MTATTHWGLWVKQWQLLGLYCAVKLLKILVKFDVFRILCCHVFGVNISRKHGPYIDLELLKASW